MGKRWIQNLGSESNLEAHYMDPKWEGMLENHIQVHVEKACWKRGEGMEIANTPYHKLENSGEWKIPKTKTLSGGG
jgi:hypothetical protein